MKIPSTDELLKRLTSADTISALGKYEQDVSEYDLNITFSEYIKNQLADAGISPAELIERSLIQRNYAYQILDGTKNPGRNKVISICLALSMSLEETQRALTIAKEGSLYPKNPWDAIIIFCINKHMSVMDTNHLLYERGVDPL